jgi:VIT1/CCC1 family predicted Fe2+/Mn2+ transporter
MTRASLAVAQELLASGNEMNLKLAREYIEKRSRFSASQLEDQRKKIMSGNVNADEIEFYNQLKAKSKDSRNKKADADIILQGIDHI